MTRNKFDYLTVNDVAEIVGMSTYHVRWLIYHDKIKARKIGRIWVVEKKDLKKVKRQRFPRDNFKDD